MVEVKKVFSGASFLFRVNNLVDKTVFGKTEEIMHVQHVFKTCNYFDYQALFNRFVLWRNRS